MLDQHFYLKFDSEKLRPNPDPEKEGRISPQGFVYGVLHGEGRQREYCCKSVYTCIIVLHCYNLLKSPDKKAERHKIAVGAWNAVKDSSGLVLSFCCTHWMLQCLKN